MPPMSTHPTSLRHIPTRLPALLAGLVLGVLLPLACIVHCLLVPAGLSAPRPHDAHNHGQGHHTADGVHAPAASPAQGHDHGSCGMHGAETADGTSAPRVVFDLTTLAALAVAAALASRRGTPPRPECRPAALAYTPLTPPPQFA